MHPPDPRIALAAQTRRTFLGSLAGGAAAFSLGGIALSEMLAREAHAGGGDAADLLAAGFQHAVQRLAGNLQPPLFAAGEDERRGCP